MSYELHLTVEPVEGLLDSFKLTAEPWKFSCFDEDEVDGIEGKWFLTTHKATEVEARKELDEMIEELIDNGYKVTRAKIEHIIFDTKRGDTLSPA